MVFTRFVEIGRVVLMTAGEEAGKIAVIIDVVDHGHVLVDGPTTGVKRQVVSFKRCTLTDLKLEVPRAVREKTLKKKLEAQEIVAKWNKTSWAKKLAAREKKASLNDLERFKLFLEKKKAKKAVKA